jgi:hypothetical protein
VEVAAVEVAVVVVAVQLLLAVQEQAVKVLLGVQVLLTVRLTHEAVAAAVLVQSGQMEHLVLVEMAVQVRQILFLVLL